MIDQVLKKRGRSRRTLGDFCFDCGRGCFFDNLSFNRNHPMVTGDIHRDSSAMGVEEAVLYAALVGFSVWLYIGSINGEFVFDDE